jgi:hypothetical protein
MRQPVNNNKAAKIREFIPSVSTANLFDFEATGGMMFESLARPFMRECSRLLSA